MTEFFTTETGLALAYDRKGPSTGPAVALFPGGGQTRHSWDATVAKLGDVGWNAFSFDLRGHGESGWAEDGRYDPEAISRDILAIAAWIDRPIALIGASLGGLSSLLAADALGIAGCWGLVLVDVTPKVEQKGAFKIRAFMEANRSGFDSLEAAADAIAAYLPHRPRRNNPEGLAKNLRQAADGRFHWHWDPRLLDVSLEDGVTRWEAPLIEAAARVAVPTLLVRGALSQIVTPENADDFARILPSAEIVTIARADHMIAGDANEAFDAPVVDFLSRAAAPLEPSPLHSISSGQTS